MGRGPCACREVSDGQRYDLGLARSSRSEEKGTGCPFMGNGMEPSRSLHIGKRGMQRAARRTRRANWMQGVGFYLPGAWGPGVRTLGRYPLQENPRFQAREGLLDFLWSPSRIQGRHHAPGRPSAMEGSQNPSIHRSGQSHDIPGTHPESSQPAGNLQRFLVKLAVRPFDPAVLHGEPIGIGRKRSGKERHFRPAPTRYPGGCRRGLRLLRFAQDGGSGFGGRSQAYCSGLPA